MAQKDDTKKAGKQDIKVAGTPSVIRKILIWGLAAVIIAGSSVAVALYLSGSLSKSGHAEASTASHGAAESTHTQTNTPAHYISLDPPFIVNFEDQGVMRYLQVSVTVMARDKALTDAVTNNMPPIRNNLIMLFGSQSFATLSSAEGKEKLRAQALEEIQAILRKEIGQASVEAVYFTNFVMQ